MNRRNFISAATLCSAAAASTSAAVADPPAPVKGVKITVLKNSVQAEFQKFRPNSKIAACDVMKEGQEFMLKSAWSKPEGMCEWAWADLRPIIHAVNGGQPQRMVSCCTDGYRPVFFLVEKVG
jgi:uncharacterized repeat protein (TIGR04076 family)